MNRRPALPASVAAALAYIIGGVFIGAACLVFALTLGLVLGWVPLGGFGGASDFPPTITPLPDIPPTTPAPTATPTATWTPSPSPSPTPPPTATFTPVPTRVIVVPTQPGVPLPPTATPTPTYPYRAQEGTPTYLSAQTFNKGCNWLGVVGQVLDAQGRPVAQPFYLLVRGQVNGQDVTLVGYAGTAPQLGLVEGQTSGFEILITETPFTSSGVFTLQLFDLNTGLPLSAPVPFDTFADCERNAVLINFVPSQP